MMSNAFDITLELSCCKHVPRNELPREWFNNKEAMLSYMEATHLGARGFVLDEDQKAAIAFSHVWRPGGLAAAHLHQPGKDGASPAAGSQGEETG